MFRLKPEFMSVAPSVCHPPLTESWGGRVCDLWSRGWSPFRGKILQKLSFSSRVTLRTHAVWLINWQHEDAPVIAVLHTGIGQPYHHHSSVT